MRIKKFVIGMIGTNCYVVSNENTKECFIVDPAVCDKNVISLYRNRRVESESNPSDTWTF